MPKLNPKLDIAKLKKIAKRNADRAAREQAQAAALLSPADRSSHRKAIATAIITNIDGIKPLRREIEALQATRAAKTLAAEKKRAALAVKLGRTRKPVLANMISQRVKAFETMVDAVTVPSAQRYLVNTPLDTYGYALNFDSFAVVPSRSWVKFRMERRKKPGFNNAVVIFNFVWQNPEDKYVVINANGYLLLHGHCYVRSDGGIFAGARAAGLEIRPHLQLVDWTNEPYMILGDQGAPPAINLHTSTEGMFDDDEEAMADVFRGYDLDISLILVPPRAVIGLVVSAAIAYYADKDSGIVQANFSDGAYMVSSPGVLVTVVS